MWREGGLIEALPRKPARWCPEWWWRHAECARWPTREGPRSTRETTLGTKAILVWSSWATRTSKGRIDARWKLAVWREIRRRLLLLLTLLILWTAILTRLRLWYLLHTYVLADEA
jgi:hypothetical protein